MNEDLYENINGYRIIHGDYVWGIIFYSFNDDTYKSFECFADGGIQIDYNDSGVIYYPNYTLSGFIFNAEWSIDAIRLQFSPILPTSTPTSDANPTTTPVTLIVAVVVSAFICIVIVSLIILKRRKYNKPNPKNVTNEVHIRVMTDTEVDDDNDKHRSTNIVLHTASKKKSRGLPQSLVPGAAGIVDTAGTDVEISALRPNRSTILEDMYGNGKQSISPKATATATATPDIMHMMQQKSRGSLSVEDVITTMGAVRIRGKSNHLEWDNDDVYEWIMGLDQSFAKYADVLKESLEEENIKGSDLVDMDTLHIKGLGVGDLCDRQKVFNCIQELAKAHEGNEGYNRKEGDL